MCTKTKIINVLNATLVHREQEEYRIKLLKPHQKHLIYNTSGNKSKYLHLESFKVVQKFIDYKRGQKGYIVVVISIKSTLLPPTPVYWSPIKLADFLSHDRSHILECLPSCYFYTK